MPEIILASTSPYRKQQLKQLDLCFQSMAPEFDEDVLKNKGLSHVDLSQQLALLKARDISQRHQKAIVIGGDQVASFNQRVLSKPRSKEKAFDQLKSLSGNEHQLMTALAVIDRDHEYIHTCIAKMKMRTLSDEQIARYIERDNPLQCCGSYRIEALGISLFESIACEDHSSIMGIPLMWLANTLTQFGVSVP